MEPTATIGDNKTLRIDMRWSGRPFSPGADYNLLFTVKGDPDAEDDTASAIQKMTGFGITVSASTALVSLIPFDTTGGTLDDIFYPAMSPGTYYWDIQAQAIADATDVRTVASGTLELLRDVSRGTETAVPVFIVQSPVGASAELVLYDAEYVTYDGELVTYE